MRIASRSLSPVSARSLPWLLHLRTGADMNHAPAPWNQASPIAANTAPVPTSSRVPKSRERFASAVIRSADAGTKPNFGTVRRICYERSETGPKRTRRATDA